MNAAARSRTLGAVPAGLYRRSVAWSIDAVLLAPFALLLSWRWSAPAASAWAAHAEALLGQGARALVAAVSGGAPLPLLPAALLRDPALIGAIAATQAASWALLWPPLLAFVLLGGMYHAVMERSAWNGSIGKRLLGLRVLDREARPLRVSRALLRHGAGALSWLTLNFGHALAAIAPAHLALHDRCSGTQVVADIGAVPRWATAWLAVVALAACSATAWLVATAAAVMRLALEQALY